MIAGLVFPMEPREANRAFPDHERLRYVAGLRAVRFIIVDNERPGRGLLQHAGGSDSACRRLPSPMNILEF